MDVRDSARNHVTRDDWQKCVSLTGVYLNRIFFLNAVPAIIQCTYREMVRSCSAYGCTERAKKGGISFHSFPREPTLRKQWVVAMKRINFVPSESSAICAKHFLDTDIIMQFGQKRLKHNVVPSIFNFSPPVIKKRIQKKKRRSRPPVLIPNEVSKMKTNDDDSDPIPSTSLSAEVSSPSMERTSMEFHVSHKQTNKLKNIRQRSNFGDFKLSDLKTGEGKRLWRVANKEIKKYQATIKTLRVKQQRLNKRIKSLQDLLTELNTQMIAIQLQVRGTYNFL